MLRAWRTTALLVGAIAVWLAFFATGLWPSVFPGFYVGSFAWWIALLLAGSLAWTALGASSRTTPRRLAALLVIPLLGFASFWAAYALARLVLH